MRHESRISNINIESGSDRRESERTAINLPVSILASGRETELRTEIAETLDISQTGVRVELSFPVNVGDRFSINSDDGLLHAKLAVFEVRWSRPQENRYIIGAKRVYGQGRWRVLVA